MALLIVIPILLVFILAGLVIATFNLRRRLGLVERELAQLRLDFVARAVPEAEDIPRPEKPEPLPELEIEPFPEEMTSGTASGAEQVPLAFEAAPDPAGDRVSAREEPAPVDYVLHEATWLKAAKEFFTGGSLLVKVGVLVLFLGVAFLLKYAVEQKLLPIELRLTGTALGGLAMLVTGWRLRTKRAVYALVLQGGGIGVLYLTIFAALRLYSLLPPALAFGLLVVLAAFSGAMAVLQDSRSLAVLGSAGGFLAPVLTSTGHGSHVALFSYYGLLNAAILGIAWFKTWRVLNIVGFVFTFAVTGLWEINRYRIADFSTAEPFLVLFFLMYVAVAVLFGFNVASSKPNRYLDGTIVFGTPLLVFALQSKLVQPYELGAALSALALAIFYLFLAWQLFARRPDLRLLSESFLAIGVAFGTLAIPLALDHRWTGALWAMEGAGLLWVGLRQDRTLARLAGVLLQVGAGLAFLAGSGHTGPSRILFLNGDYLGGVIVGLAGLFSSIQLYRNGESLKPYERNFGLFLGVWGLLWWFGSGLVELGRRFPRKYEFGAYMVFLAGSCLAFDFARRRLRWPFLDYPALSFLPWMALAVFFGHLNRHPFAHGGAVGWPAAFVVSYLILYTHEELKPRLLALFHAATFWILVYIVARELPWQAVNQLSIAHGWSDVIPEVVAALALLFVARTGERIPWPVRRHYTPYLFPGAAPIAAFVWLWILFANVSSTGDPRPLPFIPLLNPLDLTVCLGLGTLLFWYMAVRAREMPVPSLDIEKFFPVLKIVYAATVFFWLNGILARTIHFWGGVPFRSSEMFASVIFQTALSIFWSITAFCVMVFSTRRGLRVHWFIGGGLMAVVVAKLFLVDLSKIGTVERIISFVGVGVLLLVLGYFSPVPPARGKEA